MLAGAIAGVGLAAVSLIAGTRVVGEFRRRAPGTGATGAQITELADGMRLGFVGGGLLTLAVALAVAALALPVARGVRPARAAAWVLAGLSACCGGLGLVTTLPAGAPNFYELQHGGADPVERALNQALAESAPAWSTAATVMLSVAQVLAYGAVVILLALPAAQAYFRRPPGV
jgi:hypothetical protein